MHVKRSEEILAPSAGTVEGSSVGHASPPNRKERRRLAAQTGERKPRVCACC
jgi:hypothetical protein